MNGKWRCRVTQSLVLLLFLLLLLGREPAGHGAKHALHGLLLHLLVGDSLLFEPLGAVLTDLLLEQLVVALSALTSNVLQHLALRKRLVGVLLALGCDSHAHVVGAEAEHLAQSTHARGLVVLGLFCLELGIELFTSNGLATGKFGGDVLAFERLQDLAHIRVLHGVDVFEEGDEADELLVVGVALPGVEDDGVLGLLADVAGVGVDDNDLGQITVEVRQILQRLAMNT